jgi:hypothetical protein
MLESATALACRAIVVTIVAHRFQVHKIRMASRGLKQRHVSFARVGDDNLITEIGELCEVGDARLVDRPNADPVEKGQALAAIVRSALKVTLRECRGRRILGSATTTE